MSTAELPRLRPATAADENFLFRLYAATRRDELAATGWPASRQRSFLQSQYLVRAKSYRHDFPGAEAAIIELFGRPAGALSLHRTTAEWRIVDLALLPEHRGDGHGTALLRRLQADAAAAGVPLRLQVLRDNPAIRLYLRLGFAPSGGNGPYLRMEWRQC